ncbi:hypothetical protein [Streptomyces sp. NPDC047108]|uniref:hypothetical protein n=1 Tax=Streptomyces sp. NPDC047108 TaxID=3155025 RepID=UPI0033D64845
MRALRGLLCAAGLGLMGVGAWLLFVEGRIRNPEDVVVWLGGAVALHDAVIAPVVLGVGWLLVRATRRRGPETLPTGAQGAVTTGESVGRRRLDVFRGPLRGALVVGGSLTVVALPPLLRPGRTSNPTALPLDYPRNWLVLLGATAVCAAAPAALRLFRARRRDD